MRGPLGKALSHFAGTGRGAVRYSVHHHGVLVGRHGHGMPIEYVISYCNQGAGWSVGVLPASR